MNRRDTHVNGEGRKKERQSLAVGIDWKQPQEYLVSFSMFRFYSFFFFNFLLILWKFHIRHTQTLLISQSLQKPSFTFQGSVPNKVNLKQNKKQNTKTKTALFFHLPCLSNTFSFLLVARGDVVCHIVDCFGHSALLANVHHNELLAWFKIFGLWYTNNTGPSPKLSDILLLPKVMEILQLWFHRTSPFYDHFGRS